MPYRCHSHTHLFHDFVVLRHEYTDSALCVLGCCRGKNKQRKHNKHNLKTTPSVNLSPTCHFHHSAPTPNLFENRCTAAYGRLAADLSPLFLLLLLRRFGATNTTAFGLQRCGIGAVWREERSVGRIKAVERARGVWEKHLLRRVGEDGAKRLQPLLRQRQVVKVCAPAANRKTTTTFEEFSVQGGQLGQTWQGQPCYGQLPRFLDLDQLGVLGAWLVGR